MCPVGSEAGAVERMSRTDGGRQTAGCSVSAGALCPGFFCSVKGLVVAAKWCSACTHIPVRRHMD